MGAYIWNVYSLIPLTALIVSIFMIALILTKNPKPIVSKMFVVMTIPLGIWYLGECMLRITDPTYADTVGYFWVKFLWSGLAVVSSFVLYFCLVFCRVSKKERPFRKIDILLYIPAVIFFILMIGTNYVISSSIESWWGLTGNRNNYPGWYFFSLYMMSFNFSGLYILHRTRREIDDIRYKSQLRIVFVGLAITIIVGIASEIILPMFFGGANQLPLGSAAAVAMATLFTYSIIKYELFNIKMQIFVRKSLIYSTLFAMIATLFVLSIIFFTVTMRDYFINNQPPFYIGTLFVSLLLFKKFEKGSTSIVEKIFPHLKWKESEIGEVFLIHEGSGLLISRAEINPKIKVDSDLVAGMLTAVGSFVGDILKTGEKRMGLNVLSYGEVKLLIEHGKYSYMVVVFTGFEIEEMRKDVKKTMNVIDDKYSPLLKDWDGDMGKIKDIGTVIETMIK